MTTPYLQGTGAVPEATALLLRGIQTDAYGEVLGGHKAIFDPIQSGMTGVLATGGTVPNIVQGKPVASCTSSLAGATIQAAKGLNFGSASGGAEVINLPADFELRNLGSEPSFVLSMWMTSHASTTTAYPPIAGNAVSTDQQWYINHRGTADTIGVYLDPVRHDFTIPLNTPTLVTMAVIRSSAGAFTRKTYRNGEVMGTQTGTYPFREVSDSGSAPRLGFLTGFGVDWNCTLHRLQLLKVDPAFDAPAWIAAEIAANASRWA